MLTVVWSVMLTVVRSVMLTVVWSIMMIIFLHLINHNTNTHIIAHKRILADAMELVHCCEILTQGRRLHCEFWSGRGDSKRKRRLEEETSNDLASFSLFSSNLSQRAKLDEILWFKTYKLNLHKLLQSVFS